MAILTSITTRPGPAQQATVYVLVLGLMPNNWRGQTQPCPSAGTPLDTWGLHVWAKLQLYPPRTGTRSKKIRIYHAGQTLTWDLLGPDHTHWAGQPKLWDPPHTPFTQLYQQIFSPYPHPIFPTLTQETIRKGFWAPWSAARLQETVCYQWSCTKSRTWLHLPVGGQQPRVFGTPSLPTSEQALAPGAS